MALADPPLPSLDERVETEGSALTQRFGALAQAYGLDLAAVWKLADALGDDRWPVLARRYGVPASRIEPLYQQLEALPHKRHDELTPYNLLTPGPDRWGVTEREGIRGWGRFGELIERVAVEQAIDPLILGAYVWTESNFDSGQETRQHGLIAVGLASIQARDYASLGGTLEGRIARLQRDPALNLTLAAREFRARWNPRDMFGTVMDVWYPAWRRVGTIPHWGHAFGYLQLFSNRYFMLMRIMGAEGLRGPFFPAGGAPWSS